MKLIEEATQNHNLIDVLNVKCNNLAVRCDLGVPETSSEEYNAIAGLLPFRADQLVTAP